jgi:arylsulfatase
MQGNSPWFSSLLLVLTSLLIGLLGLFSSVADQAAAADRPPNVILIVADDQGWGDLSCQGSTTIRTPHLDRLAREGLRCTDFYVAQAVCTASRAALLSGCYPNRVGLQGALNHTSKHGIHPGEWLIPEMLHDRGYATACLGKWHLGTVPELNPLRNGFEEWLGIPYSNDNSKYHPVLAAEMPPLPFYDGDRVIELDPDQSLFTRRFTERGVDFIRRHADRPFFLYVPQVMPHVPIFASEEFRGRSPHGLYADVVEELDWSVGELLRAVDEHGLTERTLVIFISDNGPWLSYGEHAGSAGPYREGKLTAFEGGVRVPCLIRWPGRVPAGEIQSEPFMAIDWLPTLVELCEGKSPALPIDGRSVVPLITGQPEARSPHQALFFFAGTELHAVRKGPWKLHFPHPYLTTAGEPGWGGKPSNWGKTVPQSILDSGIQAIASRHGQRVEQLELSLFHLTDDPGEQHNLAAAHPEIVAELTALAEPIREALGDSLTGQRGTAVRPAGLVP